MALIKPEQLRSGSYSITGSFSGSFYGDGSNLNNLPIPSIDTGSLVTTSSFNSFTSSYYVDSGSFSTRVTNLENFSSSLDATFATDAELNAATASLSASISNLSSSFEIFSGSYNTGSFTGSFIGDLTGTASNATSASYALTASYLEGYISPFPYTGSAEITGSLSVTGSTSLYHSGSTILSVNGPQGEIFSISDDTSGDLLIVQSGSIDLLVVSSSGATTISGSLTVGGGITASLYGTASWAENAQTASYVENAQTASYYNETDPVFVSKSGSFATTGSNIFNGDQTISGTLYQSGTFYPNQIDWFSSSIGYDTGSYILTTTTNGLTTYANYQDVANIINSGVVLTSSFNAYTGSNTSQFAGTSSYALTASYVENAQTASYVLQAVSASHALTASYVNDLNQNVFISGSLTVLQGATIYGSSSFVYVTASQLDVSASFISVNVFEPVQRFGGLKVYDSGSSTASASLAWDSLHNHWVYQNVSGSIYTGGMLLSGPRNTGSLGDEPNLTLWYVPRSDGGDHLDNSQIYSSGSITIVTGSLTVTNGITGSLSGSATNAVSASYAVSASFAVNAQTASYIDGGFY